MGKTRVRWKNNVWMVKLFLLTPYRLIRGGNVQINPILTCALDGSELKLNAPAALPQLNKSCISTEMYQLYANNFTMILFSLMASTCFGHLHVHLQEFLYRM